MQHGLDRLVKLGGIALLTLGLCGPVAAQAQSPFSPVITVNERAITGFELDQRIQLLTFFNTPGDISEQARTGLIEDRLRSQELERVGVVLTDEGFALALDEFAARASLTGDQLVTLVGQNGIDPTTLTDFVSVSVAWRDYIRSVYGSRVQVSESDIDFALAREARSSAGVEVLLNEIILPAPPEQAASAQAQALALSRITSIDAFEAEARAVSAAQSRDNSGRLDWTPLSNYPAALQTLLLSLSPGRVTPPINITNGVALLQLREVREGSFSAASPTEIDYAAFSIAGGRSAAAIAEAQALATSVDTCDDLYTQARGLPVEHLDRQTLPPSQIPDGIALELAKLDPGEASYALTDATGDRLVFVMLCQRIHPLPEGTSRADIETRLKGAKLAQYADALVADLRAAATIVGE